MDDGEESVNLFPVGTLAIITGLVNRTVLNGRVGVIWGPLSDGRIPIAIAREAKILRIKPKMLREATYPNDPNKHIACSFWPWPGSGPISVSPIVGWPKLWTQEIPFLRSLGWSNPKIMSGIEAEGKPKPDWVVYYDEGDTISVKNVIAERIAGLLPEFELEKMNGGPIRGHCILVYSPMNTSPSPEDKRWTLDEMRQVLSFHMTELALEQYDDHDNQMHRAFGGL